jgi:pimeloyl-ACP methyl ester carboxylesterase
MKSLFITIISLFTCLLATSQQINDNVSPEFISTSLGSIAVYQNDVNNDKIPLILLHGVYFDHHLWDAQVSELKDRKVITIDMPWHGKSIDNVPEQWNLDDCAEMLIEILNNLKIEQVVAVGHSWGSMTILRAAHKYPERFASVGFCNMPFESQTKGQRRTFKLQHAALMFRNFYLRQAGKALFADTSLKANPQLMDELLKPMSRLSNRVIKATDTYVILNAEDSTPLIHELTVHAHAIKGLDDYVPEPPLPTTVITGGHVSPLEAPEEVLTFILEIIQSGVNVTPAN